MYKHSRALIPLAKTCPFGVNKRVHVLGVVFQRNLIASLSRCTVAALPKRDWVVPLYHIAYENPIQHKSIIYMTHSHITHIHNQHHIHTGTSYRHYVASITIQPHQQQKPNHMSAQDNHTNHWSMYVCVCVCVCCV